MPAQSKRPSPPARMAMLLAAEKRRMLDAATMLVPRDDGSGAVIVPTLTVRDFEAAWAACWAVMVHERAWPHATVHRRAWRQVQAETKAEFCAAFIDSPTAFERAASRLAKVADDCGEHLDPVKLSKALIAAMVLVELPENDADTIDAAALAAREFIGLSNGSEIAA